MVIDTSAIFAAITGEPDNGVYRNAIISARLRLISAVTLFGNADRPGFAEQQPLHVVPFDEPRAETAFDAFQALWQNSGHHPRGGQHGHLAWWRK